MPVSSKVQPDSSLTGLSRAERFVLLIFIFSLLLAGCGQVFPPVASPTKAVIPLPSLAATSTSSPTQTQPPLPSPTPTQIPMRVWMPAYMPASLHSAIALPPGYIPAESPEQADLSLDVSAPGSASEITWVYALVAAFPTTTSSVSFETLQSAWQGEAVPDLNGHPLLMDESTRDVFATAWGEPAPQAVQVLPTAELLDRAWSDRPSWAIIPFEELNPRWKVLAVDDQSPLRKDFDPSTYALSIPMMISGREDMPAADLGLPASNRDASRLTTVAMTGVTAMVRATAFTMENQGITYPAGDVGPLLLEADITHISNEIPFSPDCPFPRAVSENLVFCSAPKYIELLQTVGADVIELTGDHFMDYGIEATLYTLQMYDNLGWPYYGGGAEAWQGRQPVLFEHNGNKIAFMGCNIGCEIKTSIPCTAIATDSHPGAAKCDFDWISSEISRLRQEGYQVIFTFQHIEYYKYTIEAFLQEDFSRVAEAGAVIVSGSQAHQPHGFGFEDGTFIHYGLGNLFFDQFHFCGFYACDDAFIDRHIFYDGKFISTELIPIHFVDYARPRLMGPEESATFLEKMFTASGW